jgi:hypothetical protein
MANLPVYGTVTGLYGEDYGCNADKNAFAQYCDVWREEQGEQASATDNEQDSWIMRVRGEDIGDPTS